MELTDGGKKDIDKLADDCEEMRELLVELKGVLDSAAGKLVSQEAKEKGEEEKKKSSQRHQQHKEAKFFKGNGCGASIAKSGSSLMWFAKEKEKRKITEAGYLECGETWEYEVASKFEKGGGPLAAVLPGLEDAMKEKISAVYEEKGEGQMSAAFGSRDRGGRVVGEEEMAR